MHIRTLYVFSVIVISFAEDLSEGMYKMMSHENKKLEGCLLKSLTVKSKLSCLLQCQITEQCKSVNILEEALERNVCELNYCIAMDSGRLNGTTEKYLYFYKKGEFSFSCI